MYFFFFLSLVEVSRGHGTVDLSFVRSFACLFSTANLFTLVHSCMRVRVDEKVFLSRVNHLRA